ncbi:hypothetical protein AAEX37_00865 [Oligella sp. MSHR50489EDL]|uniref:DUF4282 domain-containing protein n=1 Tax=Oligella sp. MSHR50489EDL TaxID=3139409 RepID=UPI003D817A25
MDLRSLLFLDKFIVPKVVTFIYWFILFVSVIIFLLGVVNGEFLNGLLALIGGVILGRIYCEFTIVVFKINEHLSILSSKALQEEEKNQSSMEL